MNSILSGKSDANLAAEQTSKETELHVDFRYEKEIPCGTYLRGHYEVQIEGDNGNDSTKEYTGAIYDFLCPGDMTANEKGEWQSYDIRLSGSYVTVVVNGKTIINNQEVPGIESDASDFRRILITPVKQ